MAKGGIEDEYYQFNYNSSMVLRDIRVRSIRRN
nr:MAG TPA: hypothetical protein [Caudoviricetes sp.]